MTLRLTVDTDDWRAHVDHVVRCYPGLVPVVKGNGYGFGRGPLAAIAAELSDTLAVGTVHEPGVAAGDVVDVGPPVVGVDGQAQRHAARPYKPAVGVRSRRSDRATT